MEKIRRLLKSEDRSEHVYEKRLGGGLGGRCGRRIDRGVRVVYERGVERAIILLIGVLASLRSGFTAAAVLGLLLTVHAAGRFGRCFAGRRRAPSLLRLLGLFGAGRCLATLWRLTRRGWLLLRLLALFLVGLLGVQRGCGRRDWREGGR